MRAVVLLLLSSCLLVASGCGSRASSAPKTPNMTERRYKALVNLAKDDLKCEDVKYEYLGSDLHRMTGCSARADYILRCPGGPICSWIATPLKQASFDLTCPEADLTGTKLSETAYGVEGCGQRMNYVLQDRAWSAQPQAASAPVGE